MRGGQALLLHLVAILVFGVLLAGVNSPSLVTMWNSSRWLYYISGALPLKFSHLS
jgi:hypothetical protein